MHPLAGQGVNLGFGDAQVLADALAYAVESGVDIGDLAFLEVRAHTPTADLRGAARCWKDARYSHACCVLLAHALVE